MRVWTKRSAESLEIFFQPRVHGQQNLRKYMAYFWNLQLQQAQTPTIFKDYLSDLVAMDSSLNLVSNDIKIVSFQFQFLFINNIFLNLIPEEFYYSKNHLKLINNIMQDIFFIEIGIF